MFNTAKQAIIKVTWKNTQSGGFEDARFVETVFNDFFISKDVLGDPVREDKLHKGIILGHLGQQNHFKYYEVKNQGQ